MLHLLKIINLRKKSFFGLDFSFTNLTLFLLISLSVIFFFSTENSPVIYDYWQNAINIFYSFIFLVDQAAEQAKIYFVAIYGFDFSDLEQSMMFNFFFKVKKPVNLTISNNFYSLFLRRDYTNPTAMNAVVVSGNSMLLNFWTDQTIKNSLIDPLTGRKVSAHQLDVLFNQNVKRNNISLNDLITKFNIKTFFDTYNKFKLSQMTLMQKAYMQNRAVYHQRANTITEMVSTKIAKQKILGLKKVDMLWGKKPMYDNFTGNAFPDYSCAIVLCDGRIHEFHADLKVRTLQSFENEVLNQFQNKNAIIFTNIFWIKDINSKYVFQGFTKLRLESSYHGVINIYQKMDPKLAQQLHNSSVAAFNKFQQSGKLVDYNNIPLNLPKFLITEWYEKYV